MRPRSTNHVYFFFPSSHNQSHSHYCDRKSHIPENRFLYFISFYSVLFACLGNATYWMVCVCERTHSIWFNNALNMRNICVVGCITHERRATRMYDRMRITKHAAGVTLWHMTAVLVCVVPLYKFDFPNWERQQCQCTPNTSRAIHIDQITKGWHECELCEEWQKALERCGIREARERKRYRRFVAIMWWKCSFVRWIPPSRGTHTHIKLNFAHGMHKINEIWLKCPT